MALKSVTAGQDFGRVMNCFVYRDARIQTLLDVRFVHLNSIRHAYLGHAWWVLRMSCGIWCGVQLYVHSQGIICQFLPDCVQGSPHCSRGDVVFSGFVLLHSSDA